MLKKLRVIISILLFVSITFYFLDFADLIPGEKLNWLTRIQFIPAVMSFAFVIVGVILLVTLLFGRVYCSSVCPLGVFQDISSFFSKKLRKKRKRYRYGKAKTILRLSVFAVSVISIFLGFTVLIGLIDPYAAYGRIASNLLQPIYLVGNNILESIFTRFGDYTFYKKEIFIASTSAFVISLSTFAIIGFLSWKYGRIYCNTICPVGTLLGLLSNYSFFKIRIEESKCNNCGACETKCKASCIHSKEQTIDHSRCVDCFNCIDACKTGAIQFTASRKKAVVHLPDAKSVDSGKRQFLLTSVATVASATVLPAREKVNALTGVKSYARKNPISPPGAVSSKHLQHHCTSCHLCVSKCPTQVLKPSFTEYGLGGIMQPMMYFEKGYCNYNCTVCSEVCPNGALKKLTKEEKHLTQVGHVVFTEDICVVHTDGTNCGACAEHCPTQAVTMVPYKDGLTIPHIETDICVGCGGCEFICPVRPYRAIYVEGNPVHKEAKPFEKGEKTEVDIEELDFGF